MTPTLSQLYVHSVDLCRCIWFIDQRRNNRKDWGRQVPQFLCWGTNNVLVPQLLGRRFQKAWNFTISIVVTRMQDLAAVLKKFPGVIPPDPHSGRGQPPPLPHPARPLAALPLAGRGAQAPRCWDPNLGPLNFSAVVVPVTDSDVTVVLLSYLLFILTSCCFHGLLPEFLQKSHSLSRRRGRHTNFNQTLITIYHMSLITLKEWKSLGQRSGQPWRYQSCELYSFWSTEGVWTKT